MGTHVVVAVDGPSGSGKSSTARGVARATGLRYLDTGAMYRALTWAVIARGVDVNDPEAVASTAPSVRIDVGTDPDHPTIWADGVDVAEPIRSREVTAAVSAVSAVPAVRRGMVALQRRAIGAGGIVVEGRDIAAVVAPDAAVKVYLVADVGARAERRAAELGRSLTDVDETAADLARRDRADSSRTASPLVQTEGATVVDTTHHSLQEVIDVIVRMVDQATNHVGHSGPQGRTTGSAPSPASASEHR